MGYHVDQVARNVTMGNGSLGAQTPNSIDFKDHVLLDEVVQKGRYEQRLPLSALKQRFGEGQSQFFVSEAQRKMTLYVRPRQSIELQFAAAPMDLQILMQSSNRMSAGNGIGRTIGCENEHRRSSMPPRETRENVKRREVTPVQVLENND